MDMVERVAKAMFDVEMPDDADEGESMALYGKLARVAVATIAAILAEKSETN